MKRVIIIRGIPGSGKSTYVKKHFPNAVVCSADDYFIDPKTKEYKFNPAKLSAAHDSCKKKFIKAIEADEPIVVVDNTSTMLWEFQPYIQLAQAYEYDVEVIRMNTPVNVATSRNVHGVPKKGIEKAAQRLADYPGEKIVSGINNIK